MKNVRSFLFFAGAIVWSLIPLIALAQGLVPCGTESGIANWFNATSCNLCDLGTLIQKIINFAIGLSIPIAAALFAWAGILYFTSGARLSNIETAKKIFKKAFWGFLLALSAWLIVQTLLSAILDQKFFGSWNKLECSTKDRPRDLQPNVLLSPLSGLTVAPTPFRGTLYNSGRDPYTGCLQGDILQGGQCYDSGDIFAEQEPYAPGPTGAPPIQYGAYGGDIAAAVNAYVGVDTSAGPDNGNLACAWAINNVLQTSGVPQIDGNSVGEMEYQLQNGRGQLVNTTEAQSGDIIVWKQGTISHVGFCQNAGCTSAISNSSGNASFNNISGSTFRGVEGRVYRVNK